ncbi:MAG TPA: sensor histidine kinase [Nitrososphaeraceae archaeon]|nr:sensor histidine kinase [Nitrososphaeraceae archaeon]
MDRGELARTASSIFNSKQNLAFLSVIIVTAVSLGTVMYLYYSFSSNEIINIASQDVRSNAQIESYDFARILENKIGTISTSLGIIANAPAVQNGEEIEGRVLFDSAKNHSESWVEFYAWLDPEGKLVWSSNLNETGYKKYRGTDLSLRPYFSEPKRTHEPYYSSVIEKTVDNVPRLFVSLPIIGKETQQNANSTLGSNNNNISDSSVSNREQREGFKGIVYSGIRLDTVSNLLKDQLIPGFQSSVSLLDKNGTILYSQNQSYIGQNVFSNEIQSLLYPSIIPVESKDWFNGIIKESLQGNQGSQDVKISGQTNTVSYQPVIVDTNQYDNSSNRSSVNNNKNNYFMTVFIISPHLLTSNVSSLIDQQKNLSIIIVVVISVLALGIAFLVITWNKRLKNTVNAKTAELKEANEQLKAHDKMQKEFINIAAHELRTPTQAVLGYSEILQHGSLISNNKKYELINAIHRNAARLQRLTNDILDITRIESQTLRLNKEKFNINDVLLHIVDDYKNQAFKNHSPVMISYEPGQGLSNGGQVVVADKERITQVISNLLDNALKFTQAGTICVSAEVTREKATATTGETRGNEQTSASSGQILVRIEDTGSGIDPEIVTKLFSKFTTKSLKGTGLGLYISKSIIEAHGGKIWAKDNENIGIRNSSMSNNLKRDSDQEVGTAKGATFFFTLPL